jgi:3-demethylubiquinone-9 3-methyltransferase
MSILENFSRTTPILWFDSNAEEAVEFYLTVFNNSPSLDELRTTDDSRGPKGSILTIAFELDGQMFMALNGVLTLNSRKQSQQTTSEGPLGNYRSLQPRLGRFEIDARRESDVWFCAGIRLKSKNSRPSSLWGGLFTAQHFKGMNGGSHASDGWISDFCCGNPSRDFHHATQCRAARKGDGS